ncbi:MAG: glycosyltransferase [Candidatus Omnitrophica bacterium]|nr:glycosyltransferase [Candidatus Omnitrophota bacterium]
MNEPFVSVIIPVKNFARTIAKTFEYLLDIDYPRECLEIIIADGGSKDETLSIIKEWQEKYPFIKLIQIKDCPSPAYARNRALESARGDFLFFTDADCAPCPNWIYLILEIFKRDPQIAAVGGEVYTLRVELNNLVEAWCEHFRFNMVSPRYGFMGEGYFPDFPRAPKPSDIAGHKAYFFGTCNVAYRAQVIKQIEAKFWDNPTGEDMDFTFRHRSKGFKFYFAPQARVNHMHRANLKSLRKVWVTYGQAHAPLVAKYVKRKGIELIAQFLKTAPSLVIPFPIKGFVYIGNFHLVHIFALFFILGLIFQAGIFAWAFLLASFYFLFQYIKWNFPMEPRNKFLFWCRIKYLTNLSFIWGGLKDFSKYKIICIEPSF